MIKNEFEIKEKIENLRTVKKENEGLSEYARGYLDGLKWIIKEES